MSRPKFAPRGSDSKRRRRRAVRGAPDCRGAESRPTEKPAVASSEETQDSPRVGIGAGRPLEYDVWRQSMTRLRVSNRILAAVLLALVVRLLVSGPTVTVGGTAAVIALLFIASVRLTVHGRRLDPRRAPHL